MSDSSVNEGRFDPFSHTLVETKGFEDLKLGDKFPIPSRTIGDANFAAFQLASGDNHPIHYDEEYCKALGYSGMLAHGFQVLIQATPGAGLFPHVMGDCMIGFIEQSSRFLKPLIAGDTVYPNLEVIDLKKQSKTGVITLKATVHNHRGELLMEGEQKFLVKLKKPE